VAECAGNNIGTPGLCRLRVRRGECKDTACQKGKGKIKVVDSTARWGRPEGLSSGV